MLCLSSAAPVQLMPRRKYSVIMHGLFARHTHLARRLQLRQFFITMITSLCLVAGVRLVPRAKLKGFDIVTYSFLWYRLMIVVEFLTYSYCWLQCRGWWMDPIGKLKHRPIWPWGTMDYTDLQTDSLQELYLRSSSFSFDRTVCRSATRPGANSWLPVAWDGRWMKRVNGLVLQWLVRRIPKI